MGRFADDAGAYLRDALAEADLGLDWATEHLIAGTPVDVVGVDDDRIVCIELEWRRADPADNTAKLFRHLSDGAIEHAEVTVCQVFTAYYDLASGGVSSKRKNAEFVGPGRRPLARLVRVPRRRVPAGATEARRGPTHGLARRC